MCSFPVVTWIGNAAAVLSGRWGAVSRCAQDVGCSRKAMYQQVAATACAMGVSLGQIVTLLAILLPACCVPSRATGGRWVDQAGVQAGGILTVLDRVCQVWVVRLCLDEIFFHRDPVLVAAEPHSMAWVAGQRGPDRTGDTWCALLQKWPGVQRMVCDAGTGLAWGVK